MRKSRFWIAWLAGLVDATWGIVASLRTRRRKAIARG